MRWILLLACLVGIKICTGGGKRKIKKKNMFLIKSPSNNSINNIGICKNPDDNIEVSMITIF